MQSVGLYVQQLGINFPAYEEAYLYYENGIPGYTKVGAGNPIKQGDLVVWSRYFPASPGAGHIDVAAQDGTLASFVAWDSNWYPPLKLAKLSHLGNNNNYIVGYLRRANMEPIFNEGDRRNINFWLYGEDRLLWPGVVAEKIGYKQAIGQIFTSQEYKDNQPVNTDVPIVLAPGTYKVN